MADRNSKEQGQQPCSHASEKEIGVGCHLSPNHAEDVNRVLYAIADAVNATQDLDALYRTIHQVLGTVIDVTNFFIAIVDQQQRTLYFPYYVDTVDEDFSPLTDFDPQASLTGLVVTLKKPVLLHRSELQERVLREGIWGPVPFIWMGVPLLIRDEVIGVIAVQHYTDPEIYDAADLRLLTAISQQTAIAIDRKRSLQQLKRSEETYRNMFLNAPVGLYRVNIPDGIIEECNDAMAEMLGYGDRNQCIGQYSLQSGLLDLGARQKMAEMIALEGEVKNFEVRFRRKDQTAAWLRLSAKIDKRKQRLEGVAEDISDFKAAHEEKLALQEKLNRSKRMEALGLLAGGVAHDLNNMLSGIINYPALMLMQLDKDHELVRPIKAVQESGKRIAMVVDDLLTMARSAASVRETHSLNTLVEEYLASPECLSVKAGNPQLKIAVQLSALRPNISCSPVHVRKCLMNLFTNAVEAVAGKGQISITTSNQLVDGNPDTKDDRLIAEWVTVEVGDQGRGIAAKDIEHIFEPFYTRKVMGNHSGTGLGLTVVWNTMQDHQGKVLVASGNEGTRFTLLFPASDQAMTPLILHFDPESVRGSGETILVVDDEVQLRDIACSILTAQGYHTYHAASGEEAVAFIREKEVHLVLLDMLMDPGWNGRRTYEEIRKIKPQQKAIIVSGYSEGEDVNACISIGAGRFLKKPYSLEHLCLAVREELTK